MEQWRPIALNDDGGTLGFHRMVQVLPGPGPDPAGRAVCSAGPARAQAPSRPDKPRRKDLGGNYNPMLRGEEMRAPSTHHTICIQGWDDGSMKRLEGPFIGRRRMARARGLGCDDLTMAACIHCGSAHWRDWTKACAQDPGCPIWRGERLVWLERARGQGLSAERQHRLFLLTGRWTLDMDGMRLILSGKKHCSGRASSELGAPGGPLYALYVVMLTGECVHVYVCTCAGLQNEGGSHMHLRKVPHAIW